MASSWNQIMFEVGSLQVQHLRTHPMACFEPLITSGITGNITHYYVRDVDRYRGWIPASYIIDCPILPVWADGACKFNGSSYARSGAGVTVGGQQGYSLPINDWHHTSQRAELHAAIQALCIVRDDLHQSLHFTDVIIVMDSEYVVKGITMWVVNWDRNGWTNYSGRPVANSDLWHQLLNLVYELQDGYVGVVYFYHVPRQFNAVADNLAKQAVDVLQ